MDVNSQIKVGRSTFSRAYLSSVTLTEAKEHFSYIDARIVREAHGKVNKKSKKKTSSGS